MDKISSIKSQLPNILKLRVELLTILISLESAEEAELSVEPVQSTEPQDETGCPSSII